ncbi:MAG: 4a-hydroxytetrahydrobiopterin dehydratase [Bacteroidales bacterium]|nr:4a-hydroxytetrahydrobiopterin dehydratase [Bacteroidales bacterium]
MAEEYKRSPEIHFHSKKSVSIKIINEDSGEISEDDIRLANLLNQLG